MMLFLSWFNYVINGGISNKNVILIPADMSNDRINGVGLCLAA